MNKQQKWIVGMIGSVVVGIITLPLAWTAMGFAIALLYSAAVGLWVSK